MTENTDKYRQKALSFLKGDTIMGMEQKPNAWKTGPGYEPLGCAFRNTNTAKANFTTKVNESIN